MAKSLQTWLVPVIETSSPRHCGSAASLWIIADLIPPIQRLRLNVHRQTGYQRRRVGNPASLYARRCLENGAVLWSAGSQGTTTVPRSKI